MDCRNPAAFKVRRDLLRGKLNPLVRCEFLERIDEDGVDRCRFVFNDALQSRVLLFTVEGANGEKVLEELGDSVKSLVNKKLV